MTHDCGSVDLSAVLCIDEKVGDCWDKRKPVAGNEVFAIKSLQLLRIPITKEDQIDVNSHAESPVGIHPKEPASISSVHEKPTFNLQLCEETLGLTQHRCLARIRSTDGYESDNAHPEVAPRCVEDQAIDGFRESGCEKVGQDYE